MSMNWVMIGSGNGLLPIQCQAITWTKVHILSIGPLEKKIQWNCNQNTKIFIEEIVIENVVCKMVAILFWPQSVDVVMFM